METDPTSDGPDMPKPVGKSAQWIIVLLLSMGAVGGWALGKRGMVNAMPETTSAVDNWEGALSESPDDQSEKDKAERE